MSDKITVSSSVNASLLKVWDCYTNPRHIVHWNYAAPSWHCPRASNDLHVGGRYFARMEARDGSVGFDFEGIYTQVRENEMLVYQFGGREAMITFKKLPDHTLVTITFDPEQENSLELQQQGWQSILNNFKSYCEQD